MGQKCASNLKLLSFWLEKEAEVQHWWPGNANCNDWDVDADAVEQCKLKGQAEAVSTEHQGVDDSSWGKEAQGEKVKYGVPVNQVH